MGVLDRRLEQVGERAACRSGRAGSSTATPRPGTLTLPQPVLGILSWPLYWSGVISAGEWPEALRPTSLVPSHRMQKASAPMPFIVGSTTVMAIALATAASTALPPLASMRRPAVAARCCEEATTLEAKTGSFWSRRGNRS
jgi:hypothetical protein